MQTGKGILLDLGGVLKDYSAYWLLSGMVILTVLAGYYVRPANKRIHVQTQTYPAS